MTTGEVRQLFAYDAWANGLVFEAAARLSAEQLTHPVTSSFPSVVDTIAHVVGAEWVWLRRWLGENPAGFPDWVASPALADLRARLSAIEGEREVFIAGEVFLRFRPRRPEDRLAVPLQIQMLPAEMLPLHRNERAANGHVIRQGIEFDRIGRRVAYHFLRRHPGDVTDQGGAGETVRVPAAEVIHVIDPVDAGQLRGISRFAPGIVKLFLLDQYDDAELDRKKVAAMHALFITTPAPAEPFDIAESDEGGERTMDLQPGQIVMLEPGEEVQTWAPADVGQTYEPFQYRTLLQVSAALGIPYAYLSNDMLKANYSNSRLALLEFRRRIEAYQHSVMVWQICRRVWARWLDTAVMAGAIALPDYEQQRRVYLGCSWLPPKWDWVDPLKDARAEIEQIEAGLKSRTQALAERGYDADQVDAEIATV